MASIKTSALVADIKGKIGGNCFARNKAGIYVRAKIKPLNPRSLTQQLMRAYCAASASLWGDATAQEREDWQAYALNTGWTNRLGDSINIGGEAAFVRQNSLLLMIGFPTRKEAPVSYGKVAPTVGTFTASAATQLATLPEPTSGFDRARNGEQLIIFAGMPQPASQSMAPIRWKYHDLITGSTGSPPTFPHDTGTWPWTFTAGQRLGLGLLHIDADYRVAVRSVIYATAAA